MSDLKNEAVKQVTERQHPVAEVADRLGVSGHSLYAWIKRYNTPDAELQQGASQQAEIRRLKAELRRVTNERDILKNRPTRSPVALMNRNSGRVYWTHAETVTERFLEA